ncbi:hypothetical protein FKM82_001677 [Ascaphus truei]
MIRHKGPGAIKLMYISKDVSLYTSERDVLPDCCCAHLHCQCHLGHWTYRGSSASRSITIPTPAQTCPLSLRSNW